MTGAATPLSTQMDTRIDAAPRRYVWTPSDFLDLGARDAVDKALQRRAVQGRLRRIDRGFYDRPAINSLTRQPNPPDPRSVIDAVARRDHLRLLVDGMTAANDLGFTTAVPAKIVVHTEGRLKPIHLGQMDIVFRPTSPTKLVWAGRPAMRLVQALHWLRDIEARGDFTAAHLRRLTDLLEDPERGGDLRADLAAGFSSLPTWMQDRVRPFIADELARGATA
ncbi:hypothetical protein GCM10010983_35600 [Caulobacter rhizosphaerae]|nr:DUF6088 family protein [Caulobacter rhizosphaerae]GGL35510.1 hypothetical protein GCM10010983_35600 [Caulobacter rhizosphaerae]